MTKNNFLTPESRMARETQRWFDRKFRIAYKRQQIFNEEGASKELVDKVQSIVSMMPEKFQEVLELRFFRGFTNAQTMEQLDYPESSYYRLKNNALVEFAELTKGTELLKVESDETLTIKRAIKFFNNDLERIESVAGTRMGRSTEFDSVKHHSNVNTAEEMATQRLDANNTLDYVQKMIGKLAEQEQGMINMRFMEGATSKEISTNLNCTEDEVHQIMDRALLTFAEITNEKLRLVVEK
ncbi:hypothetical protein ESZ50_01285 [Weissella muntiaci]|uniref:RNA polymerase sigma-70 region 4 domain-containing protein n=1 Tax=Weissella muntiaci TaxID=2508881 RepID=A0A6C2CA79_9LACO|nr:ArpU family phage packaging/lysis transcriptional regulator [Weissella muntiaci]TYC50877.1 hypothetical protein ESZ50_01285 [Weissella muntiaci]